MPLLFLCFYGFTCTHTHTPTHINSSRCCSLRFRMLFVATYTYVVCTGREDQIWKMIQNLHITFIWPNATDSLCSLQQNIVRNSVSPFSFFVLISRFFFLFFLFAWYGNYHLQTVEVDVARAQFTKKKDILSVSESVYTMSRISTRKVDDKMLYGVHTRIGENEKKKTSNSQTADVIIMVVAELKRTPIDRCPLSTIYLLWTFELHLKNNSNLNVTGNRIFLSIFSVRREYRCSMGIYSNAQQQQINKTSNVSH